MSNDTHDCREWQSDGDSIDRRPGPKVLDVQVFETRGGFIAVEEMGTSCSGDTPTDALRGLGAALREDGIETPESRQ